MYIYVYIESLLWAHWQDFILLLSWLLFWSDFWHDLKTKHGPEMRHQLSYGPYLMIVMLWSSWLSHIIHTLSPFISILEYQQLFHERAPLQKCMFSIVQKCITSSSSKLNTGRSMVSVKCKVYSIWSVYQILARTLYMNMIYDEMESVLTSVIALE